jgi:hypothetical protein
MAELVAVRQTRRRAAWRATLPVRPLPARRRPRSLTPARPSPPARALRRARPGRRPGCEVRGPEDGAPSASREGRGFARALYEVRWCVCVSATEGHGTYVPPPRREGPRAGAVEGSGKAGGADAGEERSLLRPAAGGGSGTVTDVDNTAGGRGDARPALGAEGERGGAQGDEQRGRYSVRGGKADARERSSDARREREVNQGARGAEPPPDREERGGRELLCVFEVEMWDGSTRELRVVEGQGLGDAVRAFCRKAGVDLARAPALEAYLRDRLPAGECAWGGGGGWHEDRRPSCQPPPGPPDLAPSPGARLTAAFLLLYHLSRHHRGQGRALGGAAPTRPPAGVSGTRVCAGGQGTGGGGDAGGGAKGARAYDG